MIARGIGHAVAGTRMKPAGELKKNANQDIRALLIFASFIIALGLSTIACVLLKVDLRSWLL